MKFSSFHQTHASNSYLQLFEVTNISVNWTKPWRLTWRIMKQNSSKDFALEFSSHIRSLAPAISQWRKSWHRNLINHYWNREQKSAGENQLEIEINIDGADTGSWFTAPVTEGFLIFGFALLLAGKFNQVWMKQESLLFNERDFSLES